LIRRAVLVRAIAIAVSVVAIAWGVLAGYPRYRALEHTVVEKFSGRPWAVPARVYAEPFVLYPGMPLAASDLMERLRRLGYREVPGPVHVRGDVHRDARGDTIELFLRPFAFPLHPEPGRPVRIELAGGLVAAMRDLASDAELFDVSLEPELLAGLYDRVWEERRVVPLEEIPPHLVAAVLAIEDARYFEHGAIDWRGIGRALVRNIAARRVVEGGSTLTQQLMKNFFLSEERTWRRKAIELVMAVIAERRYTKQQILQLYLNEVYLGQSGAKGIFGVSEAAQFYFGKELADLTASEAALLAGLIRAPNGYSPYRNLERARARRDLVLTAMEEHGVIDAGEAVTARAEPIDLRAAAPDRNEAPYFVDFVRRELQASYPPEALTSEGLRIFTTLDPTLQAIATTTLREGIAALERQYPRLAGREPEQQLQGALIALHPATGEIKAMVGGRDYAASQFNRASDAARQPGSVFKPIVYFAALDPAGGPSHLLPTTHVDDAPFSWSYDGQVWEPANYENRYLGAVSVRRALEMSLNAATARVAFEIGLPRIRATAEQLGIPGPLPNLPSMVLGSLETTPLTIAETYAVLASQGQRTPARAVKQVADEHDQLLEGRPLAIDSVVSPQVSYMVTHLLEGAIDHGTGQGVRAAGFTLPAAGKTGTTNDYGDAWFAGYTPDLVTVVWVGFDRRESLGLSGARAALPIWTAFMKRATATMPARSFEVPSGIALVEIDPASGLRATSACPERMMEAFLDADAPTVDCPLHRGAVPEPAPVQPEDPGRRDPWWRRFFS
jgi:penicillin-binding protein 1B